MSASATFLARASAALLLLAFAAAPAGAQELGAAPGWAGNGAGIVEVESPAGDPCADLTAEGCLEYAGNTVWHDPNTDDDYYVTAGGGTGQIDRLERYIESAVGDQFEMRFTQQGGLAVYGFETTGTFPIAAVPFEIWNIGDPADTADDVRMIPFLNPNVAGAFVTDWEDQYTGADVWTLGAGTPITDWVYWMMPDRPNGYDLFEDAAEGFGGPGALYDPLADGDTQIDPDPFDGDDCATQGVYVNYCYMNQIFQFNLGTDGNPTQSQFVYPIGRFAIADLAGDGTTPEQGTVIRAIPSNGEPPVVPDWAGDGAGIVETASNLGNPCANPAETPGCDEFGGNTVWHDPSTDDDYYVAGGGGDGSLTRLRRYIEAAAPDEYEMRFTQQGGLAVYAFETTQADPIARVPFEIWNIGDTTDTADDVRMIPFLNPNTAGAFLIDWEDQFTGADLWPLAAGTPITDWVYWMMPDRPNGYNRFEEAAEGFGGPGALYDPLADGDTQIDPDPTDGSDCANQGFYVDYCYRLDVISDSANVTLDFVYPVGRFAIADLAGDGTTPGNGTVIRLYTDGEASPVANEPGDGTLPTAYTLRSVYPNPFRGRATVAYDVPAAGRVRLAVYDVLGREVAVLTDGLQAAGTHRAELDAARLASGLYVVVLEAETGARVTRKVTLLR